MPESRQQAPPSTGSHAFSVSAAAARMSAPGHPPTLSFARFVSSRPWLALLLVLAGPLTLTGIAMPNFALNDLEGWDVRTSDSSMAYDAWTLASSLTFPFATSQTSRRHLAGADAPRTKRPRAWSVYVQDLTAHQNMLRRDALAFLRLFETRLRATPEWRDHCLLDGSGECVPPLSLTSAMIATAPTSSPPADVTDAEQQAVLTRAHTTHTSCVTNEFEDPASRNASTAVKSVWSFGLPIAGYTSAGEASDAQARTVDRSRIRDGISRTAEAILASAEFRDLACFQSCDERHQCAWRDEGRNTLPRPFHLNSERLVDLSVRASDRVVFDYSGLTSSWAIRQLAQDGPLAGFSLVFVVIVMALHTRSIVIAGVGMLQILISFPTAFFFYRVVFGILHFGTLQARQEKKKEKRPRLL